MEIRKFKPKHGVQWVSCGWRLAKKRKMTWLMVSLLMTLAVLVLGYIPVIGAVVSAFLFPIVLCSSMIVTDRFNNPEAPRPKTTHKRTRGLVASMRYTKDMILSAFSREDRVLTMLGMAAGMMVFGIVIEILLRVVSGGVVNNPAHFWQLSGAQFASLLAANTVAYVVYLLLAMCFLFAIPLFILKDFTLAEAVKLSLKASTRNLVPFIAYAVTLAAPLVIAKLVAGAFGIVGMGVLLIVGAIVWMLFINSMYCCYRLTFK
jgi:hypothetical protein